MAIINGTTGDDPLLQGTDFDDTIRGFDGNDHIQGLGGNDKLIGGPGGDRFYINPGDGSDQIEGFTVGSDKIVLNGFQLIKSPDDLAAYIDFNGDGTTIDLAAAEDLSGGTMTITITTLQGTGAGDPFISASDIILNDPFVPITPLDQASHRTLRPPDDPRNPGRFAGGVLGESDSAADTANGLPTDSGSPLDASNQGCGSDLGGHHERYPRHGRSRPATRYGRH